jgi:hypothetical protein
MKLCWHEGLEIMGVYGMTQLRRNSVQGWWLPLQKLTPYKSRACEAWLEVLQELFFCKVMHTIFNHCNRQSIGPISLIYLTYLPT